MVTIPREFVTTTPCAQSGDERFTSIMNGQFRMTRSKIAACSLRQTTQLRKLRSPEHLDRAVKYPRIHLRSWANCGGVLSSCLCLRGVYGTGTSPGPSKRNRRSIASSKFSYHWILQEILYLYQHLELSENHKQTAELAQVDAGPTAFFALVWDQWND